MFRNFSTSAAALKRAPLSSKIPQPTAEIPDVPAFLTHIGRSCSEFAETFPSWDALFTTTSKEMKTAGVDVKARKYILEQVERYRKASFVDNTPVADAIKEIKLYPKKNGGERKFNQYLAKKRILERIQIAQNLKLFRKEQKMLQQKYNHFDRLHSQQNHHL